VVKQLQQSKPILAERVEKDSIKVVGAVYQFNRGEVTWLSER